MKRTTSLPARGAWIEMSRTTTIIGWMLRRSPQGERGLKSYSSSPVHSVAASLPARGAWIEIYEDGVKASEEVVAPRKGSVD